ncbi:MAG TPA: acyltransferase [Candidatus Binatia bacterium]
MGAPLADHPADARQPGVGAHAHFPAFDGLRAIAATSVALYHTAFLAGYTIRGGWAQLLTHGDVGVTIFFLISGFLLYRPFVSAHLGGKAPMPTGSFLWRRFLRIYPAYWFAFFGILLTVGFHDPFPSSDLRSWVTYLGLLQIYDAGRVTGGVTQTWTLGTEVSFYLFLPLYAALIRAVARGLRRPPARVEAIGIGLLIATSFAWRAAWILVERHGVAPSTASAFPSTPGGVAVLAQMFWLPAFLDLFAIGMALALASASSARPGGVGPILGALRGFVASHPIGIWVLAACCYWVTCFHMGLGLAFHVGFRKVLGQTCYAIVALFVVLPAVFPRDGGAIDRLLRARPVAFLGLVSYGMYLWHQACIPRAFALLRVPQFRGKLVRVFALALPLTFSAAAASYYLVERPAMRLKDLVRPAPGGGAPPPR